MRGQRTGKQRLVGVIATIGLLTSLSVIATQSQASATPQTVRLHLGSDFRAFVSGTITQTLATSKNSCALNSAEPLIDLSSTGPGNSAPGLVVDGIGVKGSPSSGNGSPCSQTDSTESLTMRPGTALAGRTFNSVRLDLEMTGNAIVVLTLSQSTAPSTTRTYRLQTGTSITADQAGEADYDTVPPYDVSSTGTEVLDACAAPNNSGPNSFGNDNCRWRVTPGFNFDTVRLTTSQGTVALEGGGDFGNSPDFETVLYLSNAAPIANDDTAEVNENTTLTPTSVAIDVVANDTDADAGTVLTVQSTSDPAHGTTSISGGTVTYTPDLHYVGTDSFTYTVTDGEATDTATVLVTVFQVICRNDVVTDTDGDITGTFERLNDDEVCKRYDLDADAATSSVLFSPDGAAEVDYRGYLAFDPVSAPMGAAPLTLALEYDPLGGFAFQPVEWCIDPVFNGTMQVTGATLPPGETWCIASETTVGVGGGQIRTTWQVFGTDDPRFK